MSDHPQAVAHTTQQPYGTHPEPRKTRAFVQWKGTDVCLDFSCECGNGHGHYDGYFAYTIECPACHAVYEMPTTIYLRKCDGTEYDRTGLHIIPEVD
jgi:hypothetical protein